MPAPCPQIAQLPHRPVSALSIPYFPPHCLLQYLCLNANLACLNLAVVTPGARRFREGFSSHSLLQPQVSFSCPSLGFSTLLSNRYPHARSKLICLGSRTHSLLPPR